MTDETRSFRRRLFEILEIAAIDDRKGQLFSRFMIGLILLNVVFLIAGCFFDICAIILVFTPMILPVLNAYQIDLVHWGVVQVLNVCIGFLTPPFGVGLYVLSDLSGLSVTRVMKAVAPFLVPLLMSLALITFFPQLVLWLPGVVFG